MRVVAACILACAKLRTGSCGPNVENPKSTEGQRRGRFAMLSHITKKSLLASQSHTQKDHSVCSRLAQRTRPRKNAFELSNERQHFHFTCHKERPRRLAPANFHRACVCRALGPSRHLRVTPGMTFMCNATLAPGILLGVPGGGLSNMVNECSFRIRLPVWLQR